MAVGKKFHYMPINSQSHIGGPARGKKLLMRRRYIHISAHWNAAQDRNNSDLNVVFINHPTANNKRVVHPNE